MAESFYGGQPGTSFIIVAYFESIDEMIEKFKQGPSYEAVHFDEHVLINTYYKDDKDNGKIYRRGYDYSNDMGGAIYIGSIVGPPGAPPRIELTTIDDVIEKYNSEEHENDDLHTLYEGEYAPLYDLVPGKDSDGNYRDSIKWACCNVHNEDNPYFTIAYIGFVWPYLVVDYEGSSVSPYYNRDSEEVGFSNTDLIERVDDETHPFWEKWHISVPKGIKGDALKNFRVITANTNDGVESYTGQEDDRENGREILVYDYYHFDKEEGGEPVTIYLGDYNMITGIILDEDGTLTINYTHDDDTVFNKAIQWIDSITLDPDGTLTVHFNTGNETTWENILKWVTSVELTEEGHFTIEFNNGDDPYETDLIWVREVSFDETGVVTVIYNNGETTTYPNIKWITDISLDEDGTFHVQFNTGDEYSTTLIWVREVSFDPSGAVTVIYNNGDTTVYTDLKWITEVSLDEDGSFHIGFNTGEEYDTNIIWVREVSFDEEGFVTVHFNDGTTQEYPNIKWITNISLSTDGLFHIDFNTGDEYETNLIWVTEVSFDEEGIVTVHFNDGTTQEYPNIKWITNISLDEDGSFHIDFNTGDEYDTTLTWVSNVTFDTDGTITIHYNDGTDDLVYTSLIKWISSVELTDEGHFTIEFNNGDDSYETDLIWVKKVSFEEDGIVTVTYNNGNIITYPNIKWITNISLAEDGTFHIDFNNGDEYNTNLIWVSSVDFQTDGTVCINYNNGDSTEQKNLIQWITSVELTDNGDFIIKFNNGASDYTSHLTWVNNITFNTDGTVTIYYNDDTENLTYTSLIKWINSVELTDEGHFTIEFNNGDDSYETDLIWVKELAFFDNGNVTITYNNGQQTSYSNIKWITNLSLDENGAFHIDFNTGDEYNTTLTWVKDISVDNQGIIIITYNDGTSQELDSTIQWITNVSLSDTGEFVIDFNNGQNYSTTLTWIKNITVDPDGTVTVTDNQNKDIIYTNLIKTLEDVSINTGSTEGTGNQKVHIVYNTGEEEDIGNPLNYIMRMEMVESNYHLLVWYSSPDKRQEIIDEGKSYIFKGEDGWLDLGSVKDESGILIGTNYDYDLPQAITQSLISEIATILDTKYPDGLEGTDLKGKVITVGNDSTENKLIYAYDYDKNSWYYVGQLAGGSANPENILLFDTDPLTKTDNLYEGGAWFVLEDFSNYD